LDLTWHGFGRLDTTFAEQYVAARQRGVMKNAIVIQVFAASPSDVQAERDALEGIIAEVNQMRAAISGIRLELIRWETQARPGFGADPQDVINRQMPPDYDIFLGILWTRFGTPTGRAESGTEEEFKRAYDRFQQDPKSVSIMVYFKDGHVDPSTIDLEQLAAVRRFRERVPGLGGLYGTFRTTEDFQGLLRAHLASEVTELESRVTASNSGTKPSQTATLTTVADALLAGEELTEDLGFWDHLEVAEEKFAEATDAVIRIGEALDILTARMRERTTQMNEFVAEGPNLRGARRVAKRTAEDMEQFVARATVETPIMSKALQEAVQSFGNAATYTREIGPSARESLQGALATVAGLRKSMEVSASGLFELRTTTASFPRVQKDLNLAKRKSLAAYDNLLAEIQTGINLTLALEESMRRLIAELGG
jgi:hypothetical protein